MVDPSAAENPGAAPRGAVAELSAAVDSLTREMEKDLPFGTAGERLETISAARAQMDRLTLAMLEPLARMEASGELRPEGGHTNLAEYVTHAWGVGPTPAKHLAALARGLHQQSLPHTRQGLNEGSLSVAEAGAIAWGADEQARHCTDRCHPDAGLVREKVEYGMVGAKRQRPRLSVAKLGTLATDLGRQLHPVQGEQSYQDAFDGRGAQLSTTFQDTFELKAWGPAEDGEKLKAALEAFTVPYGQDPHQGRHERTYDALMAATGFAHAHQECAQRPGPTAFINITVPLSTFIGIPGDEPARTQDGQAMATSVVRAMAGDAALRRLIYDPDTGQTQISTARRCATGRQRAQAFYGHTTCAWEEGCDRPVSWCEADHIHAFSHGGPTTADNLQPLCREHNQTKHHRSLQRDQRYWAQHTGPTRPPGRSPDHPSDRPPGPRPRPEPPGQDPPPEQPPDPPG